MKDYLKCTKCKEDQHEGHNKQFCKCVDRNIKVAKEQRKRGESWSQQLKNAR